MFADQYDDDSSHDGRDSVGKWPTKKKPAATKPGAKGQGPAGAAGRDGGAGGAGGGSASRPSARDVGQGNQEDDSSINRSQQQQTQTDPKMSGRQQNTDEYDDELEDENGVPIEARAPRKTLYQHVGLPPKSHLPGLGVKKKDTDLPSLGETGTTKTSVLTSTQSPSYSYSGESRQRDKRRSDNTQNTNNNNGNNNNNNGGGGNCCCAQQQCCNPYQPCGNFFNPCQQQIYQSPCQIGVIPMRSAAFEAPRIPLPKLCDHLLPPCCDEDEDEDGVAFQFKPQTNCRTEVTFTIEPKPQPPWLTMLNCGFKPMVNCSAPPCYLSPSGNPGMNFVPGTQTVVNRTFGSQVAYAGMANFPTLDQIQKSFPGSKVHGMGQQHSESDSEGYSDEDSLPASNRKGKSVGSGTVSSSLGEDHHKHHQGHLQHRRQSRAASHFHPGPHHPHAGPRASMMHPHGGRASMMHPHGGRASMMHHHHRKQESEDSFQKGGDDDFSLSDDWHY